MWGYSWTLCCSWMFRWPEVFNQLWFARQLQPFLEKKDLTPLLMFLSHSGLITIICSMWGCPWRWHRNVNQFKMLQHVCWPGSIYWHSISFHTQFRVLLLTYTSLYGLGLGYLKNRLPIRTWPDIMLIRSGSPSCPTVGEPALWLPPLPVMEQSALGCLPVFGRLQMTSGAVQQAFVYPW